MSVTLLNVTNYKITVILKFMTTYFILHTKNYI